jgi:hypothetical protein
LKDNELYTHRFEIESKLFFLDLKENPNGRYLKITEKSGEKRSFIIVPEGGIDSFISQLFKFHKEYNETTTLKEEPLSS